MNEFGVFHLFVLPAGLGLFGFIEPCSIGSSLLFIKYLEDEGAAEKIRQTALFALTRAGFMACWASLPWWSAAGSSLSRRAPGSSSASSTRCLACCSLPGAPAP